MKNLIFKLIKTSFNCVTETLGKLEKNDKNLDAETSNKTWAIVAKKNMFALLLWLSVIACFNPEMMSLMKIPFLHLSKYSGSD